MGFPKFTQILMQKLPVIGSSTQAPIPTPLLSIPMRRLCFLIALTGLGCVPFWTHGGKYTKLVYSGQTDRLSHSSYSTVETVVVVVNDDDVRPHILYWILHTAECRFGTWCDFIWTKSFQQILSLCESLRLNEWSHHNVNIFQWTVSNVEGEMILFVPHNPGQAFL